MELIKKWLSCVVPEYQHLQAFQILDRPLPDYMNGFTVNHCFFNWTYDIFGIRVKFKLQKYKLPYPEAIFTYSQFQKNPEPFYHLVRDLFPSELVATPTHKFFTLLHNKNILHRIYTQNIDALEHIAGVPEEKIIEAHGTFHRCYCTKCNAAYRQGHN